MMNHKKLVALLLAGLMTVATLASCTAGDPSQTETGTKAETEPVTAIPRFDYMDADVASDVIISQEDYTGLTLSISNSYKVTDETVKDYIENIRFQNRVAENGSTQVTDKALKLGDDAFIYYKGFMDGEEFDGGSNWDKDTPHQLGLGSATFIPGFEDALVGIVPSSTSKENPAEIQVTFPDDYSENLAGKEATFRIVVVYSVQYMLPEYNRSFVENTLKYEPKKDYVYTDGELIAEYEAYIRESLVKNMASGIENAKIDALWQYLTAEIECKNLPETEMNFYVSAYKDEVEYYFDYYTAGGGEEFKAAYPDIATFAVVYMGLDKDANWEDEIREMAEKMVKKDMITHAIAELEGVESVTEEEYRAQIQYWVNYYYGNMTEAEVVQSMGEVFLRESAFSEKMQTWLLERVTFTYKDGTPVDGESAGETEAETDAVTDPETEADATA